MATRPWLLISKYDANRIRRLMADVLVGPRGLLFVRRFYEHLFAMAPQLRSLFPINMAEQSRKLLLTISIVVKNLDNDEELQRVVEHLRDVHAGLRIEEEHIEAFLEALAYAFRKVHGAAFPPNEWALLRRAVFSVSAPMLHPNGLPLRPPLAATVAERV